MHHTHTLSSRDESHSVGHAHHVNSAQNALRPIVAALFAMTGLFCSLADVQAGTIVIIEGRAPRATAANGTPARSYENLNSSAVRNSPAATNDRLYESGAFDFKAYSPSATRFTGSAGSRSSAGILSFYNQMTQRNQERRATLTMSPLVDGSARAAGPNVASVATASPMVTEGPWNQPRSELLSSSSAGLTTSQAAGAFQLAVWQHENDFKASYATPGSVNFGQGPVTATISNVSDATVLDAASKWISSQSLNSSSSELASLAAINGANYEDRTVHVENQVDTSESSSNLIWLVLAAIGAYPIMRRRSRAG